MFGKEKKEKRFVEKESQGMGLGGLQIIVDTQTGVNYLVAYESGPTSITPLLNQNGEVVIDKLG